MALWAGLGQASTVAQVVGVDAGGIISMILLAVRTARRNIKECEQLARRVVMIADLLPYLQDPDVMRLPVVRRPLDGLEDTLREAYTLVATCQKKSFVYRFVMADRQAERFRDVQGRIDSYLLFLPFISHLGITRRLDRNYNALALPNGSAVATYARSQLVHGAEEFTLAELAAATGDFAAGTEIGVGSSWTVYRGKLRDGREVAIKRYGAGTLQETESRLFGFCEENGEHLVVYEYQKNGTLYDHLHTESSAPSRSPVTASWKMRIEVLHSYAASRVIHRDIKPSNIDSEYYGHQTVKSDVYSFGVVMLELLTGKQGIFKEDDGENVMSVVDYSVPCIIAGELEKMLDMRVPERSQSFEMEAVELVAYTAVHCVRLEAKHRPAIEDIVANLETAVALCCSDEPDSDD